MPNGLYMCAFRPSLRSTRVFQVRMLAPAPSMKRWPQKKVCIIYCSLRLKHLHLKLNSNTKCECRFCNASVALDGGHDCRVLIKVHPYLWFSIFGVCFIIVLLNVCFLTHAIYLEPRCAIHNSAFVLIPILSLTEKTITMALRTTIEIS